MKVIFEIFLSNLAYNATHTQISSEVHINFKIDTLNALCQRYVYKRSKKTFCWKIVILAPPNKIFSAIDVNPFFEQKAFK